MAKIHDQREKLIFLIEQGVFQGSHEPRRKKDVATALLAPDGPKEKIRIAQSRLSDWINGSEAMPAKHFPRLAELFDFDAHWPEWRDGSAAEFKQEYARRHGGKETRAVASDPDVREAMRRALQAWWAFLSGPVSAISDRMSGGLRRRFERAMAVLDQEELSEDDIFDLVTFEECLELADIGYEPSRAAEAAPEVVAFLRTLCDQRALCGAIAPLDDEMVDQMETAVQHAYAHLEEGALPTLVRDRLESFVDYGEMALSQRKARLGVISEHAIRIEGAGRDILAAGVAALRLLIGRRLDLAPDFAIFREPLKDGGTGPDMVVIPGGSFWMGSANDDPHATEDEKPRHEVTVRRFAMARFATTFDAFGVYCDAVEREWPGDERWGRGLRPVINVSWEEAEAYAAWLSDQTNAPYRLPSEAAWEYCCRAGTTGAFSFDGPISTDLANYNGDHTFDGSSEGVNRKKTVEVGSLPANPWRLHEMHGNVWEWCADAWKKNYEDAPTDGSARKKEDESSAVLRGGSWSSGYPRDLRSADRHWGDRGLRSSVVGFRLSRTLVD